MRSVKVGFCFFGSTGVKHLYLPAFCTSLYSLSSFIFEKLLFSNSMVFSSNSYPMMNLQELDGMGTQGFDV